MSSSSFINFCDNILDENMCHLQENGLICH